MSTSASNDTGKRLRETPWARIGGLICASVGAFVAVSQVDACWPETVQAHASDVVLLHRDIESLADEDARIREDVKENSTRVYGLVEQAIRTMDEHEKVNSARMELIQESLGLRKRR